MQNQINFVVEAVDRRKKRCWLNHLQENIGCALQSYELLFVPLKKGIKTRSCCWIGDVNCWQKPKCWLVSSCSLHIRQGIKEPKCWYRSRQCANKYLRKGECGITITISIKLLYTWVINISIIELLELVKNIHMRNQHTNKNNKYIYYREIGWMAHLIIFLICDVN